MQPFYDALKNSTEGYTAESNITSLSNIAGFIFNLALGLGISITLINIAYGFFQFITSKGEKTAVKKAQDSVTWAIAGFIIALLAWSLKDIALRMLGATDVTP